MVFYAQSTITVMRERERLGILRPVNHYGYERERERERERENLVQ